MNNYNEKALKNRYHQIKFRHKKYYEQDFLNYDYYLALLNQRCVYCNSPENITVDRIDSDKGYTDNNCVAACFSCNIFKNNLSTSDVISIFKAIKNSNNKCQEISNSKYNLSARYLKLKRRHSIKEFSGRIISKKQFDDITSKVCEYCKTFYNNNKRNGIDRIDNNKGYVAGNCVPCCKLCNSLKYDLNKDDFIKKLDIMTKRYSKMKKAEMNKMLKEHKIKIMDSIDNKI